MVGKYANLIIDISHEKLDRTFQYKIPEQLKNEIEVGSIVTIPFGTGNRLIKGYVMQITDKEEYDLGKLKEIIEVVKECSGDKDELIKLAGFMKQNYGSTMIAALKTVLPVKKSMKPKESKNIILRLSEKEAEQKLSFYEQKHQVARFRLLKELIKEKEIPSQIIVEKLGVSMPTIKAMEEQGILQIDTKQIYRNPVVLEQLQGDRKQLSVSQQKIVDGILTDYYNQIRKTYLIHGITGSGKTEVYMEIISEIVETGKQAIVLIPEIALTYQTVMRFYKRFGDQVSTLHSRLSEGEKFDQFERAKKGEISVMIGPRSALFTPFSNLGIIVIDEEHEGSYKSEPLPKYHAREVAIERARLAGASVILGSATPSITSYFKAKTGEFELYELTERVTGGQLPKVYTVDLRQELKNGNRSIFSDKLRELILDRIEKKEQIMLFLNRRGYASFVSCRACGHVMKCPHCDVSLSAHRNGKLICHYCGYEQQNVKVCPACGSKYIGGMRAGTEQIEALIKKEFPDTRVLRMDMDTTKKKEGHTQILSAFANGDADILVGTQMIVKGHDFPNVTLVGILAADMSLYANDYRAGERTFQLLTQAAGRAGRGRKPGEVVIQTYSPDNYSIIAAAKQDYKAFYEEEIAYRSLLSYPPCAHMVAILIESMDEILSEKYAKYIAEKAKEYSKIQVIGPAQAGISKINDSYRQTVYLKHENYQLLTEVKDHLELLLEEKDNHKVRVQFDFDPMNVY